MYVVANLFCLHRPRRPPPTTARYHSGPSAHQPNPPTATPTPASTSLCLATMADSDQESFGAASSEENPLPLPPLAAAAVAALARAASSSPAWAHPAPSSPVIMLGSPTNPLPEMLSFSDSDSNYSSASSVESPRPIVSDKGKGKEVDPPPRRRRCRARPPALGAFMADARRHQPPHDQERRRRPCPAATQPPRPTSSAAPPCPRRLWSGAPRSRGGHASSSRCYGYAESRPPPSPPFRCRAPSTARVGGGQGGLPHRREQASLALSSSSRAYRPSSSTGRAHWALLQLPGQRPCRRSLQATVALSRLQGHGSLGQGLQAASFVGQGNSPPATTLRPSCSAAHQ